MNLGYHFIERCIHCNGVIAQCRCPGEKREVRTRMCARCGDQKHESWDANGSPIDYEDLPV